MKTRLILMFLMVSFVTGGMAQTAASSDAGFVTRMFTPNLQGLDPESYAALPHDRGFPEMPSALGERSSRRNSSLAPTAPPSAPVPAAQAPCQKPAELFSAGEYGGPFNRVAAWFSRKPEMTTVPNHRRGRNVCALSVGEKFDLFYKTTLDPVTFIGAGFDAGISQWQNDDREFGEGAAGYGKRYGAALADRATRNFFHKFFYPALFQQDPRYYRQGHGTANDRIGHALAHGFVARSDSGHEMPNLSLWAAISSTVAVSNLYHPGNERGIGEAAKRGGISFGMGMGWDVLREFWPEIVHKMRLPFRERTVVPAHP